MGGAHRDIYLTAERIKSHLVTQLKRLQSLPAETLLSQRYDRLLSIGNLFFCVDGGGGF